MSAQPQRQQSPPERRERQSTEKRLTVVETRWDVVMPTLATKADIGNLRAELKEETGKLRTEIKEETSKLRAELKEETGKLRAELKEETGKLRTEIALVRKDIEAMGNKLIIRLAGVLLAFIGAAVAVLRYWPAS